MDRSTLSRLVVFVGVCIPLRLAIGLATTLIAFYIPRTTPVWSVMSGAWALGFAYGHTNGTRTHGFLGGRVWWGKHRIVHMILWMNACLGFGLAQYWAGSFLLVDALFSLFSRVQQLCCALQTVESTRAT